MSWSWTSKHQYFHFHVTDTETYLRIRVEYSDDDVLHVFPELSKRVMTFVRNPEIIVFTESTTHFCREQYKPVLRNGIRSTSTVEVWSYVHTCTVVNKCEPIPWILNERLTIHTGTRYDTVDTCGTRYRYEQTRHYYLFVSRGIISYHFASVELSFLTIRGRTKRFKEEICISRRKRDNFPVPLSSFIN